MIVVAELMSLRSSRLARRSQAVVLVVLVGTHIACYRPANADMVGEAIERSGRNLQVRQSIETELEALYEVDGPWTLLVVPPTGVSIDAISQAGVSEVALARVREAAAEWRGGQYLVQLRGEALLSRTLAEDAVKIDRQFIVSGRGPVWILSTLKKAQSTGPPTLVSFSQETR